MQLRYFRNLGAALIGLCMSGISNAVPVTGQGTWESTLMARDLDGNLSTAEAYYDSTLNITWLADAALSKTETFGVEGIVTAETNTKGRMGGWSVVADWFGAMNAYNGGAGYLGQNSWRRPNIFDDSNESLLNGSNPDTSLSELASLYYDTLGNSGGLTNSAEFVNMQAYYYATDTEVASDAGKAWSLAFHGGYQYKRGKSGPLYSLAILDGDVGEAIAAPIPSALWLMGSGLIALVGFARRRRSAY
jgi:hypothetical protein